jgi:hypothetical protein
LGSERRESINQKTEFILMAIDYFNKDGSKPNYGKLQNQERRITDIP